MDRAARLLPLLLAAALLLSGCADRSAAEGAGGPVRIVATTDVWGDVARQIGGSHVAVTSIIDDPAKDPHEYEADARDQLAVSRARILLENGGGYDDFLDRLRGANRSATVLNAAALSGYDQAAPGFNEHLWYDLPTVRRVAAAIADELRRRDTASATAYSAALRTFDGRLDGLMGQEAAIRRSAAGQGVAITEPVPLRLTDACGLTNRTPAAFSRAVEAGRDVPPGVLQQQLALFRQHRVALLAVNEQTGGPTTDQTVAAARTAGIPVVGFRETLPEGRDYVTWIRAELDAVRTAVGR